MADKKTAPKIVKARKKRATMSYKERLITAMQKLEKRSALVEKMLTKADLSLDSTIDDVEAGLADDFEPKRTAVPRNWIEVGVEVEVLDRRKGKYGNHGQGIFTVDEIIEESTNVTLKGATGKVLIVPKSHIKRAGVEDPKPRIAKKAA